MKDNLLLILGEAFRQNLKKFEEKGYRLTRAKVGMLVYWKPSETKADAEVEEVLIVLAEVVLSLNS